MAGLRRFRHRTAWPCDDNPEVGGGPPGVAGAMRGDRVYRRAGSRPALVLHSRSVAFGWPGRGLGMGGGGNDIPAPALAGWVMGAEGGIRVVGTAPTVGDLLAGPGRAADVVLLDLDLDDGSTVERNVADILAAGPVVLVLSASDKPVAVRAAMRAGALGYVPQN